MKNGKLLLGLGLLFIAFLQSCTPDSDKIKHMTGQEVQALLKEGNIQMVDVREPDELKKISYNVDGIKNLPLSNLETSLSELPKDEVVIVACRTGHRSMKAANILVENGFTNVINLDGGIVQWEKDKLPVKVKSSCCADPSSPNCNPDGTCKKN